MSGRMVEEHARKLRIRQRRQEQEELQYCHYTLFGKVYEMSELPDAEISLLTQQPSSDSSADGYEIEVALSESSSQQPPKFSYDWRDEQSHGLKKYSQKSYFGFFGREDRDEARARLYRAFNHHLKRIEKDERAFRACQHSDYRAKERIYESIKERQLWIRQIQEKIRRIF